MGMVDGPGVRLVVFLAGCNLRCAYCHNPETWQISANSKSISSQEILDLYQKYKVYYGQNGGVTFSGGEPLVQYDFLLETVKLLKKNNIHVALDTAGVAENFEEVLKLVDLVILDIKAIDEIEYKNITSHDMFLYNKFLHEAIRQKKKLWLRQVVVPGINDNWVHIEKLKEYIRSIPNVERVELLPYHTLGVHKYRELNIPYRLDGVKEMDKNLCKQFEDFLNE